MSFFNLTLAPGSISLLNFTSGPLPIHLQHRTHQSIALNVYQKALGVVGNNHFAVCGQTPNRFGVMLKIMSKCDPHSATCKVRISSSCPLPLSLLSDTNMVHTRFPTESLHAIQRRLDVIAAQATHPRQSALENAVMYTANAVDDELDAMVRTPVDPAEQEVLNKELKLMTKLLEKLTHLEARRRGYSHARSSRTNDMNGPTGGAHHTSSSFLPPPSA